METYVTIEANSIDTFNARIGSGSDQTVTEGFLVNWDPITGFTGQGWRPDLGSYTTYGPAATVDDSVIKKDLEDDNLNTLFSEWENRVSNAWNRLDWIRALQNENFSCVTEV